MPNLLVVTIGSRGDVQPYINLSQGLQAAGHTVTLATNPTLCPLVEAHGVHSAPVGPAVDMGLEGARLLAASFNNMWIGMLRVMQLGARLVEQAYPDVLALCHAADLVITSDTGSGIAEAERLEKPWISVTLQPGRIPLENASPGLFTRLVWGALGGLMVLPINRMRRRLGAPPVEDIAQMMSKRLVLLPVSQHVAAPDPRWPAHVRPTGYWFARPQAGWRPPEELVDFLAHGERPIVVSLGVMSMHGKRAAESARIVLEAVQQAGARAVVQGWEAVIEQIELPSTVFAAGALPHDWLFAQAAAVVHHGGFGTTAAALRSGAPSLIVPHIIDQFYWGQRVYELGVGPHFITRGKLNAGNLQGAIRAALDDGEMRARAAELGAAIRAEPDGVTQAVELLEGITSDRRAKKT